MSVSAQQCANAAEAAVLREPPITYEEEDCQAFIEQTVKRAGGRMKDYRGSNDMYRNACSEVVPLAIARLQPGMLLFIVAHDGGEPDRYKADGLGNASHVGWYTGGIYQVVHSSATRGGVAPSTLKNGWTHAGWLKEIDYGERPGETPRDEVMPMIGYIDLPADETVFLRISPSRQSKWFARVPGQDAVDIVSTSGGWTRVQWGGHDGYVMSEFITTKPVQPDPMPPDAPSVDMVALLTELEGLNKRQSVIIAALKGVM
mgnify:CR=1 FL=1